MASQKSGMRAETTAHRFTKIVATIGPASEGEEIIERLILSGMNVARLNFSHDSHEGHQRRMERLRRVAKRLGKTISILQDLQGPKIRTGPLKEDQISLSAGQALTVCSGNEPGNQDRICIDLPELTDCVEPGGRILLADGQLELIVNKIEGEDIQTEVVVGGTLRPNQGVHLPGAHLKISSITPKDRKDLAFGLSLGVDAVAVSLVQTAENVIEVRQAIEEFNGNSSGPILIAKLERPEALDNLDSILEVVDGVMVARGDLGVEMPPEMVPIAQKQIIEAANRAEKIVITATQMLESMISNPRPTRAEASDVANAIFDGTDAVMLSGETAAGRYPEESVRIMAAIILQAEANLPTWGHWHGPALRKSADDAYYIARAAREMAHDRNVTAIAVFTQSGRTALLMSKVRPNVPILAFTPNPHTYQKLSLFWGVTAYHVLMVSTIEAMLGCVEETLVASTPLKPGQQIVLVCGFPVGLMRLPNLALLHTVGAFT